MHVNSKLRVKLVARRSVPQLNAGYGRLSKAPTRCQIVMGSGFAFPTLGVFHATMSTRTLRKTRQASAAQHDGTEKENTGKLNGVKTESRTRTKVVVRPRKLYCSCRQPDDKTPMIMCVECKEWCVYLL